MGSFMLRRPPASAEPGGRESMRPLKVLLLLLAVLPLWAGGCAASRVSAPTAADLALVDDVGAAHRMLETARTEVRINTALPAARRVSRLVDLGLLRDAEMLLTESAGAGTADFVLAEANLRFRQYRFAESRTLVDAVLAGNPQNREALLLSLRLETVSGDVGRVRDLAGSLVARGSTDAAAAVAAATMGYAALRTGDVTAALEWAERARAGRRPPVDGWVLEAAVRAALGDLEGEAAALRGALALDPLHVEARYRYGLAGWWRGQIAAAGEQWRLAIEIDPLHLPTHSLLGGVCALRLTPLRGEAGGTPTGEEAPHHDAATDGPEERFAAARGAAQRGFAWYASAAAEEAALDSALAAFRLAVDALPGDLAAHRGIAAVLRRRSLDALQNGDSLEALARQWPASATESLTRVVPRLGDAGRQELARAVSWRLGELEGFLPLLDRLGARVHLAEIHEPIAAAAGMAALPPPTALGHCGWAPDAAGLVTVRMEDVDGAARDGAPELVHAIVHLVHDGLLTDDQRRRLRELYRQAVIDGHLLDARSAADEVEYLARGFEAHLGMDLPDVAASARPSGERLLRRDPALVAFIDELHTIVGAGAAEGAMDASNIFKPALSRGELQCIGATTLG